ncbi:histidine phosphatase family protein [Streptomyces sp. NBC_00988]|uniref:histidine phosphatase family protein n=1 Tax=Streptomyces sp. NBC_00988 TaxID=2903704 RepID=UPI0038699A16|nr:histidine phosphatase family protein [Streptomyces sp. NBC_00988]
MVRHGAADAFGTLTEVGRRQTELLAERLARLPIDTVWHSPLPRAVRSAQLIGERLNGVPVREAAELTDHIPHVPDTPTAAWAGVFDGYDPAEATKGGTPRERADRPVRPSRRHRDARGPGHPRLPGGLAPAARPWRAT